MSDQFSDDTKDQKESKESKDDKEGIADIEKTLANINPNDAKINQEFLTTMDGLNSYFENNIDNIVYSDTAFNSYLKNINTIKKLQLASIAQLNLSKNDVDKRIIIQFQENLNKIIDISQEKVLKICQNYINLMAKLNQEKINQRIEYYIKKGDNSTRAKEKAESEIGKYKKEDFESIFVLKSNASEQKQDKKEQVLGHCNGLTAEWLISMHNHEEDKFFEDLQKIVLWGANKDSEKENIIKAELELPIERYNDKVFLNFMEEKLSKWQWFQEKFTQIWSSSKNIDISYNVVKPKSSLKKDSSLKEVYSFGFLFTNQELESTIEKLLNSGQMFYLATPRHAIGCYVRTYQGEKIFYCYDSNDKQAKGEFTKISEIASFIRESLFGKYKPPDYLPIVMSSFSFENDNHLDQKRLMNLETTLIKQGKILERNIENENLITFLIKSGSINTLDKLIQMDLFKATDTLMIGKVPYPPLGIAVYYHQYEMILFLLDKGAVPKEEGLVSIFEKQNGITLKEAIEKRDLKAVEILARLGANPNLTQELLDKALEKNDKEIYTLLLKNPKLSPKEAKTQDRSPKEILIHSIKNTTKPHDIVAELIEYGKNLKSMDEKTRKDADSKIRQLLPGINLKDKIIQVSGSGSETRIQLESDKHKKWRIFTELQEIKKRPTPGPR